MINMFQSESLPFCDFGEIKNGINSFVALTAKMKSRIVLKVKLQS